MTTEIVWKKNKIVFGRRASIQMWEMYLFSDKPKEPAPTYCTVCDVTLSRYDKLLLHYQTEKHKRNQRRIEDANIKRDE